MSPPTDGQDEPRGWLFLLLCLAVVASVYAPALGAPFIWDDQHLVSAASPLRNFSIVEAFMHPFWLGALWTKASAIYFRPLTSLSLAADFQLHGDNPAGYHLTNLALHLVVTGLLFSLLRRRGLSVARASLFTLLWALLPRLTEDVAWVSGRTDVLASAWVLLGLWVYRPGSTARLAGAAVCGFAALLCKESGIALFPVLLLFEFEAIAVEPSRRRWRRTLGIVGASLPLYALLRWLAGAVSGGDGIRLPLAQRALTVLEAVGRYCYMLVNPLQPRSLLGLLGISAWGFVGLGALVLAAVVLAAPRLRRASVPTLGYVLLGALPLLLVLHFVALPVSVVAADRYLYLPSAAWLLAVAPALNAWLERRRWMGLAVLGLTIACGVRTASRVADYGDEGRFWVAASRGAPHHPWGWNSLGATAYRAGLLEEALQFYQQALSLPGDPTLLALDNTALLAAVTGRRELAQRLGNELVRRQPSPEHELRRAVVAFNALEFESAKQHAQLALGMAPGFEPARGLVALVDEAAAIWPRVLAGTAPPGAKLATAMQAFRYQEVVAELRRELQAPSAPPLVIRQALLYVVAQGTPEDARALLPAYLERYQPPDAAQLAAAVTLRVDTARQLRAQLAALH